jgi:uncharacterized membrane protein
VCSTAETSQSSTSEGLLAVADPRRLPLLAFPLAAAELGILLGPAPIRVAAGLTLFFLPGLVITRLIQTRTRIEGTEQLLLVPGMSLAVAVIIGLVLDAVHIPLTAASWGIALGLVTVAGLVVRAIREGQSEVGRPPHVPRAWLTAASSGGRRSLSIGAAAMFAMAALAVGAAVVIGVLGQRDRDSKTAFTELWALPAQGSASAVRLGVRSHERGAVRYRIRVSIDGRRVRSQALTLRPGQTWHSMQPVTRSGARVGVALLTSPQGPVYREVHVTAG